MNITVNNITIDLERPIAVKLLNILEEEHKRTQGADDDMNRFTSLLANSI